MPERALISNNGQRKSCLGALATFSGYGLIMVTWLILGSSITGWPIPSTTTLVYSGTLYLISAALIACAGIMAWGTGGTSIDVMSLVAMAAVLGCLYLGHRAGPQDTGALRSEFCGLALGWAVCFMLLGMFSLPSEPVLKSLLLLCFALGCLASAGGEWMRWPEATWLGGVAFLVCSVLSAITALHEGLRGFKMKKVAPLSVPQAIKKDFFIHVQNKSYEQLTRKESSDPHRNRVRGSRVNQP